MLGAVVVVAVLLAGACGGESNSSAPAELSEEFERRIASAQELRALYFLPADRAFIVDLIDSADDVGSTSQYHFPLTADELAEIGRRSEFQGDVSRTIQGTIVALPGFGGMYFDHSQGGALVVLLAGPIDGLADEFEAALPADHLGVEVRQVAHTEAELITALMRVPGEWRTRFPNVILFSAALDTVRNGLKVEVPEADIAAVEDGVAAWAAEIGFAIRIEPGQPEVEADDS